MQQNNFTVLEDGVSQKIVLFEKPDQEHDSTSQEASASTGPSHPPLAILLIDELNTQFTDMAQAWQGIAKFLQTQFPVLHQPMALMAITNRGLVPLQGFTADGGKLLTALNQHHPALPYKVMNASDQAGIAERVKITLAALEEIVKATANYPGRKNLLWVTSGFPESSALNIQSAVLAPLSGEAHRGINLLVKSRVSIYTFDPAGLRMGPGFHSLPNLTPGQRMANNPQQDDDPHDLRFPTPTEVIGMAGSSESDFANLALAGFARGTGGKAFYNRSDLDGEMQSAIQDGDTYYTLAYYPSNHNWDGKFRAIRIKLDRAGLNARTREGYYADPDPPPDFSQIKQELAEAAASPLNYMGLPLQASISRRGRQTIRITIAPEAQKLHWTFLPQGSRECHVTVVAADLSRDNRLLGYESWDFHAIRNANRTTSDEQFPVFHATEHLQRHAAWVFESLSVTMLTD